MKSNNKNILSGVVSCGRLFAALMLALNSRMVLAVAESGATADTVQASSFDVAYFVPGNNVETGTKIKVDKKEGDVSIYYSLGGIRLRFAYTPSPDESPVVSKIRWELGSDAAATKGRICSSFKVGSCSGEPASKHVLEANPSEDAKIKVVYWEPEKWLATNALTAKLVVEYNDPANPGRAPKKENFKVNSRLLQPDKDNPMKGSDVAMLEGVLWQLGIAPNSQKPNVGYNGIRKTSNLDVFDVGCHTSVGNCVGPATSGTAATMETMVWRFKYPNEINVDPANVGNVLDHSVTAEVLNVLADEWNDYLSAYNVFSSSSRITHDHIVGGVNVYNDDNEETADDWASYAVRQWNTTYSNNRLSNLRTLVNVNTLTREMLVEGWARKEAGQGHWGWSGDRYRIVGGAADSKMSLGFSQVQSRYIYGSLSTGCEEVRDLNMMHPKDNLSGFVVWTANQGCGESFYQAFTQAAYDHGYDNTREIKMLRARYGTNEQTLLLQVNNAVQDFSETDYERLTKGVAGYNQGFSSNYWGAESLANSYRRLSQINYTGSNEERKCQNYPENSNDRRRCVGYLYASYVKEGAGIPLVSYQWRTQVMMDVDGVTQPVDVCFWYGESEWRKRTWAAQRNLSVANNDYACPVVNEP